jgi:hypothetical protein
MTAAPESMTHEDAVHTMASERYLLEEMSELERYAFEEHLFSCADCAEDVRIGDLMRAGAREAARKQPIVFQPRRPLRWAVAAPWAAAASLALALGYQLVSAPALDRPYALEPTTLRPASRGADAVVRLAADDRAIALALEADAPVNVPHWLFRLRTSDGREVAAGRVPAPPPGMPLLLLVPASALTSADRYMLSLRDRDEAPPMAEYQFAVVRVNSSNGAQ